MSSTWGESTPCTSSCWGMTLQKVSESPGGQGGCKPVTCPYHKGREHLGQHWKEHCQQNEGSLLYSWDQTLWKEIPLDIICTFCFPQEADWNCGKVEVLPSSCSDSSSVLHGHESSECRCWRWCRWCRSESSQNSMTLQCKCAVFYQIWKFSDHKDHCCLFFSMAWQCLLMFDFPALLSAFKNWRS